MKLSAILSSLHLLGKKNLRNKAKRALQMLEVGKRKIPSMPIMGIKLDRWQDYYLRMEDTVLAGLMST